LSNDGSPAPAAIRVAGGLEASTVGLDDAAVGLRPARVGWEVLAWSPDAAGLPAGLRGAGSEMAGGTLLTGPADGTNAAVLRDLIPWLRPRLLGLGTSAGTGDRLGLATPGHVAAFRANPGVAPVLAQQSARELGRTGRTFAEVVDAATYGALGCGWRDGYGADADHLKTIGDVDDGIRAGCTMFTADPIDLVPDLAADAPAEAIEAAFKGVSWAALEDDEVGFERRYPAQLELESGSLELSRPALRAAAARFAPAVAHVAAMYRHLAAERGEKGFEFEVAVDEIAHRTTHVDHVYLATELHRLGVAWVSLAPRFVGRFEKGVDFLGNPSELARDVAIHSEIARALGGYKISVHSGSDKFSVYADIARAAWGRVHLKTSGTSYLVALSTIAATDPALMGRIWALLAAPGTREILHVTYGAVLNGEGADADLGAAVRSSVWTNRDAYWRSLEEHIGRHLRPFAGHDEEQRRHRDG
jgi:hypothetical protein